MQAETQETAADGGKAPARGTTPVYELIVLGELMVQPMYGYALQEVINRILGPGHAISWGTIYPLIRRLEQAGLAASDTGSAQDDSATGERGRPKRVYTITEAGKARFFTLMLTPADYDRDYRDFFLVKLTKMMYLQPVQQLDVLRHYEAHLENLLQIHHSGGGRVILHPCITDDERPYIMRFIDYRLTLIRAERDWVADMIAEIARKV
jgi:DNA-binding PadR family transcriptional regulator